MSGGNGRCGLSERRAVARVYGEKKYYVTVGLAAERLRKVLAGLFPAQ